MHGQRRRQGLGVESAARGVGMQFAEECERHLLDLRVASLMDGQEFDAGGIRARNVSGGEDQGGVEPEDEGVGGLGPVVGDGEAGGIEQEFAATTHDLADLPGAVLYYAVGAA